MDYEFAVWKCDKTRKIESSKRVFCKGALCKTNLKSPVHNPFKIGEHFKEQLLKKKTVFTIFLKMFLFCKAFGIFSTNFKGD